MQLDDFKRLNLPILKGNCIQDGNKGIGNIVEFIELEWRWLINEADKPIPKYKNVVAVLGLTESGTYASSSGEIIEQKSRQYRADEYRLVYHNTEVSDGQFVPTKEVVSKLICCISDYKPVDEAKNL